MADFEDKYSSEQNEIEQARETAEEVSGDDVAHQKFENGLTARAFVGTLFVGFIMLPGSMYMGLVVGNQLGPAAQWVTVILFSEIARRSFQPLKKQELYMILYVAGGLVGQAASLFGGFGQLIWHQYLVQSPQIGELAKEIPSWVAPAANDPAIINRTFWHPSWMVPIVLLVVNSVLGRIIWVGAGYALFRITSDVERLPFPLAPIAAAGATALAEAGTKEESWRWQVFSTGTIIGLIFGSIYVFIPTVTGALFGKAIQLIPIPFIDFTANTENVLPAALSAVTGDIGGLFAGFVLPFPIVVTGFVSSFVSGFVLNPILYHMGMFPDWTHGLPYLQTVMATTIDFWLSVHIGTGVGIGVIGLLTVTYSVMKQRGKMDRPTMKRSLPPGRGDWNIYLSLGMWLFATICQVGIVHWLVPDFPLWIVLFYGFIYTPVISYVSARLTGITGVYGVDFPYLKEATIIKSGYQKTDIWFVGLPMHNFGSLAQKFREIELTGTKFTSVVFAEFTLLGIVLPASFLFWSFFWRTSPIPSQQFPFVQMMWPQEAVNQSIWWTANKGNLQDNWLFQALRPWVILGSGIGTVGLYFVAIAFKVPLMIFYGLVGGLGQQPMMSIPTFIGGLLGRYYFKNKFGQVKWTQYGPVLGAGFGCGTGLMGMTGIAIALITKSVNYLPF